MSNNLQTGWFDSVTSQSSTQLHPINVIRFENQIKYLYTQADDAVTAGDFLQLDYAASATGKKVTPCSAEGNLIVGASAIAVTDEYYFWMQVNGVVSATVANGVAAGDKLSPSTSAGVAQKAKTRGRFVMPWQPVNGGTIADSTTYTGFLVPTVACTLVAAYIIAQTKPAGGTNTVKILNGSSSGNTMLGAATFDPTSITANNQAQALTLTSTAADLAIAATGAGSGVYLEWAAGSQSTDGVNAGLYLEFEPTQVDVPFAIALEANSSGSAAAKSVYLLNR